MANALELIRSFRGDMARARALIRQGKIDEPRQLAEKYDGLFPKDLDLLYIRARLAYGGPDRFSAEPLLERYLELDPSSGEFVSYQAVLYAETGRREEAMRRLEAFRAHDRDDQRTLEQYLPIVLSERGLPAALEALRNAKRRASPGAQFGAAAEMLRMKALSMFDLDVIRQADTDNLLLTEEAEGASYNLRAIYESFEPMGCNCEFGYVQRAIGAEPMALFRWTSVTPANLLRLLSTDLAGYEQPDIYALEFYPNGLFKLVDKVFETYTYTGAGPNDVVAEELLDRVTRRQGFLKRKFLQDASSGRKIFLYKAEAPLSAEDMDAVEAETRRLGVRHLLFVVRAETAAQAGKVEFVSDTRAIGRTSQVMPSIQHEEWKRILIATYDRFLRGSGG